MSNGQMAEIKQERLTKFEPRKRKAIEKTLEEYNALFEKLAKM